MTRISVFCVALLCLVGCGGGEFTAESLSAGGTFNVGGEAGETSVGGQDGLPSGGSDAQGGEATAGSGGSDTPQGGEPSMAGTSSGGSNGGMAGSSAGTGGSSAGTDTGGSAGSGGTGPVMVCNPKATQCANGDFQTCKNDGSAWTTQTCEFVCDGKKGCLGECEPGTKKCDGLKSLACDSSGTWVTTETCAFTCGGAGKCGGECVPGTQECSGSNRRQCKADGYWETVESCQFVCNFSGGTASCGGSCANGTKQCSGKTPQTCVNNAWSSGSACPFVCTNATGTCGGECVPGSAKCGTQGGIQTCSPQGTWLQEGASCPFVCTNGACGGSCVPNSGCPDDGNPCTDDVCNSQGTLCMHPNKSNGLACGSGANSVCDAPDTCQNGACQQNFKPNTTACTNDNNTCTTDTCNGAGSCTHPAAPANTVCRAAGCADGVVTSQAVCGGSTSCPAAVTTQCFGSCNAQANACMNTAPTKIEDAYDILASDNDANAVYFSVRTQAGVSQIVKFVKGTNTKTVLYEVSDSSAYIRAMIVAGSYIYFSETYWVGLSYTGQVKLITTTSTKQAGTVVSGDATFGFAKNSTRVYWNDGLYNTCNCSTPGTHHVYSVAIGGTTVAPFGLNFGSTEVVPDIEVTETDLYIWQMGAPTTSVYKPYLSRYNLANPTNGTLHADLIPSYYLNNGVPVETRAGLQVTSMPGLTKTGTYVFANTNTDIGTSIFSFKIADDTRKLLASATNSNFPYGDSGPTMNFVADDTYVYYANKRVPVGGGSLSYWGNHDLATLSTLTADAGFLYFGSYGYWNGAYDGSVDVAATAIYQIAK